MARYLTIVLLIVICAGVSARSGAQTGTADRIVAGPFTDLQARGGLPDGWQHKDIKNKTSYTVMSDAAGPYLRAESRNAASGLFRATQVDPKQYPIFTWQWKVAGLPAAANEKVKSKDDCAARVFVIFSDALPGASVYSRFKHKLATTFSSIVPPGVAICYVWANKLGRDESLQSPYTDWIQVVAVESGSDKVGQWVSAERNVVADFQRLFGGTPTQIVGVAVMTDTDQTGASITSYYRELVFKTQK